jgi:glucokinase
MSVLLAALIADIGGTNTRCAVARTGGSPENIQTFRNRDFADPAALLDAYLAGIEKDDRPTRGAIAVAAPVLGEDVRMINIDWRLSSGELQDRLRLEKVDLMNDFEAIARALPKLRDRDLRKIGPGTMQADKPKAVIGPGTGLGVACLIPVDDQWRAVSGEGGHVTMAAAGGREAEVIGKVRDRLGHCSAERLISGPGISLLHATLHDCPELDAAAIADLAAADDRDAVESFEMFFRMLGTVAANLALTVGAFGGVYIGGGIIPRHADRFAASGFREQFQAKGRYADYLESIPTYLITAEHPALTGLAAYAESRFTPGG